MSAREYEDYVEEVVRQFDFWNKATVRRNERFPGVRQPGAYEVDIAFEVDLTELISFLLIVECKNHGRPVTRPVIQQLAQTRDAINAQKAAVVSPRGFTKEAIKVAGALGIALWVIALDTPVEVVMAYEGLKILGLSEVFFELRSGYLKVFGIEVADQRSPLNLVNADSAEPHDADSTSSPTRDRLETDILRPPAHFDRGVRSGSAFFTYESHPMFDPDCAALQVFEAALAAADDALLADQTIAERLDHWRRSSIDRFPDPEVGEMGLELAMQNDWPGFYALF